MTRRHRATVAGMIAGTVAAAVAGCFAPADPPVAMVPGVSVAYVGHSRPVGGGTSGARVVARAQAAFGLDLLARRCAAAPTANQVTSPASAAMMIEMLQTGAQGGTRAAISRLLHLPAWSSRVLAAQAGQHRALVAVNGIRISNHVFTAYRVRPGNRVLNDLATGFGADLYGLNFARHPAQATDVINQVVARDTGGLVRSLFDAPLSALTTTVLTDALSLQVSWQQDFDGTDPADFHTADGRTVRAPTMDGLHEPGRLRRSGGWTSLTLPYRGGQLAAVVLLPPPGSGACSLPPQRRWPALTSGRSTGPVGVLLPRLHLSDRADLLRPLAALGLPLTGDYRGFGVRGE